MNLSERLVAFVVSHNYNLGQLEEIIGLGHSTLRKAIKANRVSSDYLEAIFQVVGGSPEEKYFVLFGKKINIDPVETLAEWMREVNKKLADMQQEIIKLKMK